MDATINSLSDPLSRVNGKNSIVILPYLKSILGIFQEALNQNPTSEVIESEAIISETIVLIDNGIKMGQGNILKNSLKARIFWLICQEAIEDTRNLGTGMDHEALRLVIGWGLAAMPKMSVVTFAQLDAVSWYLQQDLSQIDSKTLYDYLERHKLLTAISCFWVSPGKSIQDIKFLGEIDPEILSICKSINLFLTKMPFTDQIYNIESIENKIIILREKKFPHVEYLEDKTQLFKQKLAEIQAIIKLDVESGRLSSQMYSCEVVAIAFHNWKYIGLLRESVFEKKEFKNKMVFHLFLDKLFIPNKIRYEGFLVGASTSSLIQAIERIECKDFPIENFRKKISFLLSEFIIYSSMTARAFAEQVMKKIQTMVPGDQFLIPSGCSGHGTALLVVRLVKNFQLIQFNTGGGIQKWHHRLDDTNRYQTFLIKDHVPLNFLLDQKVWKNLFINDSLDMDPTYKTLALLGKKEKFRAASQSKENFEAKQTGGTCSVQCLMAVLRFLCMEEFIGTAVEKKAIYKMIKTEFLYNYYLDNKKDLNKEIVFEVGTVINKLIAEKLMYEISEDVQRYCFTMNQMHIKIHANTPLERYAALREGSRLTALSWEKEPKFSSKSGPGFELALAKFKHFQAIKQNMLKTLMRIDPTKVAEMGVALTQILSASAFPEMGVRPLIESSKDVIQEVLKNLNKYRESNKPLVKKLIKEFKYQDKIELAKWVKTQWKTIDKRVLK